MKIKPFNGIWHPFDLNKNHLEGYMPARGVVEVDNSSYYIKPSDFYTEEKVHLYIRQDFYETETQRVQRLEVEEESKRLRLQEEAQRHEIEQQFRVQNALTIKQQFKEFQSQYHIPFATTVRIKPVLSGLSVNSSGDGANKKTVFHLYVEEDFRETVRFGRSAGSYLCTPLDDGKFSHLDNYHHEVAVTCKRCLQIMERWRINN